MLTVRVLAFQIETRECAFLTIPSGIFTPDHSPYFISPAPSSTQANVAPPACFSGDAVKLGAPPAATLALCERCLTTTELGVVVQKWTRGV